MHGISAMMANKKKNQVHKAGSHGVYESRKGQLCLQIALSFGDKWITVLNKCLCGLMLLIIKHGRQETTETQKEIQRLELVLKINNSRRKIGMPLVPCICHPQVFYHWNYRPLNYYIDGTLHPRFNIYTNPPVASAGKAGNQWQITYTAGGSAHGFNSFGLQYVRQFIKLRHIVCRRPQRLYSLTDRMKLYKRQKKIKSDNLNSINTG